MLVLVVAAALAPAAALAATPSTTHAQQDCTKLRASATAKAQVGNAVWASDSCKSARLVRSATRRPGKPALVVLQACNLRAAVLHECFVVERAELELDIQGGALESRCDK